MTVTRESAKATLAVHDPIMLGAVLEAAGIPARTTARRELAHRISERLWWYHSTPLGYALDRTSLGDIVAHVAKRLQTTPGVDPHTDPWAAARSLTQQLVPSASDGVSLDDLDPVARQRTRGTWLPTAAWGGGATSALGGRVVSGAILKALASPIGRLLPLLPPIAPYVRTIRRGSQVVFSVSGPAGVLLTLATINQAFGRNDEKVVPLVLGLGALPALSVAEAEEIDAPVGPDDAEPDQATAVEE